MKIARQGNKRKWIAPQFELPAMAEAFNLAGEKITLEDAEKTPARRDSESIRAQVQEFLGFDPMQGQLVERGSL